MKPTLPPLSLIFAAAFSTAAPRAEIILASDGLAGASAGAFGSAGIIREFSLSSHPGLAWSSSRTSGIDYLHLTYSFQTATFLAGSQGRVFLDAEIDEGGGSWFNERGEALVAAGGASSWEIDEPGYVFGNIFGHYTAGAFDNSVFDGEADLADDVALGLGFTFGDLQPGDQLLWELLISEQAITGGWGTVLHQWDPDAGPGHSLYLAGRSRIIPAVPSAIPEPSTWTLLAIGLGMLGLRIRKARFQQPD